MSVICFDLDGTLVHLTRSYEDIVVDALGEHLADPSPELAETYSEAFFAAFEALEPEPFRRGMEAVLAETGADADPAAMVDSLREAEYAATAVPEGARASLEGLGEAETLVVLTNGTPDWQVGKLAHHDLQGLFDAVVTSYEAGAHKPDAAPFDLVRERLPAEEYVMVGDDDEADVEGARAAGFTPIRYEHDTEPSLWTTLEALL